MKLTFDEYIDKLDRIIESALLSDEINQVLEETAANIINEASEVDRMDGPNHAVNMRGQSNFKKTKFFKSVGQQIEHGIERHDTIKTDKAMAKYENKNRSTAGKGVKLAMIALKKLFLALAEFVEEAVNKFRVEDYKSNQKTINRGVGEGLIDESYLKRMATHPVPTASFMNKLGVGVAALSVDIKANKGVSKIKTTSLDIMLDEYTEARKLSMQKSDSVSRFDDVVYLGGKSLNATVLFDDLRTISKCAHKVSIIADTMDCIEGDVAFQIRVLKRCAEVMKTMATDINETLKVMEEIALKVSDARRLDKSITDKEVNAIR